MPAKRKRYKLADAFVARLKATETIADYWDDAVPSFGVRVMPSGIKTWIVGIRRPGGGAHGRYRIGEPGEGALKCKDARAKAKAALGDRAKFFAERDHAAAAGEQTFKVKATEFLAHGRTKRGRVLREATVREYRRALLDYAKPLHAMPVTEVTRADVVSVISRLAREHPVSAMRTRAALSRFWSWLVAGNSKPPVQFNIVTGTEGYETGMGERTLEDEEIQAVWQATADGSDFGLIVRLALWTGCRRAEAGGMCRSELKDGIWTVPGTRTKNHRALVLPLPRQAREALDAWPEIAGRRLLFGRALRKAGEEAARETGFQGWSQAKARLDDRIALLNAERRLGRMPDWDLHDLRRTAQTRMRKLGIDREIVNRVLNHAMGPIDETYDQHEYLKEKRGALQRWADELDRIVAPAAPAGTNVVELSARRKSA
jgi:integrase